MSQPDLPPPEVPDLVSLGHLAPFGSSDIGLLVLDNGELTVQPSPVEYRMLWDYSSQTGKLAYSSEFFHQSENKNLSVSDLWVYDYHRGTKEMWLKDNVTRAVWAPDGERVTAAIYNPNIEKIELVFISGPDEVDLISECPSMVFSWSPVGDKLAYVNGLAWKNFGVDEACLGTYLVTFPNGFSSVERDVTRVSDFGTQDFAGFHLFDEPRWALEQNALIYPDQPFWIVPLDESPAFIPQSPDNQDPMNLPRPFGNLWSSQNIQLVGNVDTGSAGFGGVWIYQL